MKRWLGFGIAWMVAFVACVAFAQDVPLSDSTKEGRAQVLFSQLRCEVCAGQSLAGSGARLAIEMRNLIRAQVKEGKKDGEILAYFADRYGPDILMNPPVGRDTALLWAAPLIFVLTGVLALWMLLRRKNFVVENS